MPTSLPFYLVSAFSTSAFGGNPAAIIFVDAVIAEDTDTLHDIAATLNQPITVAVYPPKIAPKNSSVACFRVRFMGTMKEPALCGHGSLAVAGLMFAKNLVPEHVDVIALETYMAGLVRASRKADGWSEIQIPAALRAPVSVEEFSRIKNAVDGAFERDVLIRNAEKGIGMFAPYVLIELDAKEDLKGGLTNMNYLRETGFIMNVVTTDSVSGEEAFVSRMFSPLALVPGEDHVCGSAHSLLVPYWFEKKGISGLTVARQVSARGGELKVEVIDDGQIVSLLGQTNVFSEGQLLL